MEFRSHRFFSITRQNLEDIITRTGDLRLENIPKNIIKVSDGKSDIIEMHVDDNDKIQSLANEKFQFGGT